MTIPKERIAIHMLKGTVDMLLSIVSATHKPASFNSIPETHFLHVSSPAHSWQANVVFVDPQAKHAPELSNV